MMHSDTHASALQLDEAALRQAEARQSYAQTQHQRYGKLVAVRGTSGAAGVGTLASGSAASASS